MLNYFLQLDPEYRDYVWGGQRLRPGQLTAESWVIYENDRIKGGELNGKTLAWAAETFDEDLLGSPTVQKTGKRFPLLIKLLDCAQWLSLQVHPDNRLAEELEGPGNFGKTEAWYVVDAVPGAQLIAGFKPGTGEADVDRAIRDYEHGAILDLVQYQPVRAGESIFMPAGTIHALGPGLMIYEVQQTSDWTYRVYDWGRPQTETRKLHIEKSIRAVNPELTVIPAPAPDVPKGGKAGLVSCPYFTLDFLAPTANALRLNTERASFHAITVIAGQARLATENQEMVLNVFESALVPASLEEYQITGSEGCQVLKSST